MCTIAWVKKELQDLTLVATGPGSVCQKLNVIVQKGFKINIFHNICFYMIKQCIISYILWQKTEPSALI